MLGRFFSAPGRTARKGRLHCAPNLIIVPGSNGNAKHPESEFSLGNGTPMDLYESVLQGEVRAAAKLMRLVDDDFESAINIMKRLYAHTGRADVIGVTGNPGAGKSSLVNYMIDRYRKRNRKVGVVAIDPTSPFSGGAILGDRVRMDRHFEDEGVFIRSLATRGHLGGLSKSTGEVIRVMEAWGADPVIVETVGVGQDEVDVAKMARTSIVVMVPGMGDEIQAIKAGIMEIADIFVVNKADRTGADRAVRDINMMLDLVHPEGDDPWRPRILRTVAFRNEGIDELVDAADAHREWLERTGKLSEKRRRNAELQFFDLLYERISKRIRKRLDLPEYEGWSEKLAGRDRDPYDLAERLEAELMRDPDMEV